MNKESFKSRIARGWGVVKSSWSVIRSAKVLLLIPVLGFLVNVLVLVALFVFGFRSEISGTWDNFGIYPNVDFLGVISLFLAYVLMTISNTFFTGVASHNVLARFNGQSTSLLSSFRAAWRKKKELLLLGLVSSVIGYALAMVAERLPFVGKLVAWMGEVSWYAASFFAIPIIMVRADEKVGPKRAVKESSLTLKNLWKEGFSSQLSIGVFMLASIFIFYFTYTTVGHAVYVALGKTDGINVATAMVSMAVVILGILAIIMVFNLIGLIARCALLHYGKTGKNPDQYDISIMKAGMTVNKAKKLFS